MLPTLLVNGGTMIWVILIAGAVALVVFVERVLHCHRAQINSAEFLNGVRNVLKRENVVEAISICDATPGPVARLVKTAILARDRGRDRVREAVEEAGLAEVPLLEEKLNLLATIAQIAPLLGLLGTIIGFMDMFKLLQREGSYAHLFGGEDSLSLGVWKALICAGAGIAVAIPAHAGYNYLVSRINKIVLDMERAAGEIVNIVTENGNGNGNGNGHGKS
jgi:biopolymer transport protein ExbB